MSYRPLRKSMWLASVLNSSGQWRPPALSAVTRRGSVRFLLTSAGIKTTSIHDALVELLGKPIAESSALSAFPPRRTPCPAGLPQPGCRGLAADPRISRHPFVRTGVNTAWCAGAHRAPQSARHIGCLWSRRLTSCWWAASTGISAPGCGTADWQIACRRCDARRSLRG